MNWLTMGFSSVLFFAQTDPNLIWLDYREEQRRLKAATNKHIKICRGHANFSFMYYDTFKNRPMTEIEPASQFDIFF